MDDGGLELLEPWLGAVMARLGPGHRIGLARKIGKALRDANAKRIRANAAPDGTPFEPRKLRRKGKGSLKKRKGRMFPKVALARNLRVLARPDQVEVAFRPLVADIAAVHHYGKVAPVDPHGKSKAIARYPARPLLGFGPADLSAIDDVLAEYLDPGKR